jgi:hypothetical protein
MHHFCYRRSTIVALEPLSLEQALSASARLLGLAIALQTVELLQLRHTLSDAGIWRYSLLAREHAAVVAPLRWIFSRLLPYRAFLCVLIAQLACATVVIACGWLQPMPVLLFTLLLTCVRFRGTFNGGSDCMTVAIAMALSVASCAHAWPLVCAACLGYIAVQSTLSYAIAGLTKLKEAPWRDGRALQELLRCHQYGLPKGLQRLLGGPRRMRVLSLLVIGFECGFVLALVNRDIALCWIALGTLFHLGNAAVLGLNRFLFAWLASYPALLYFSELTQI